MKFDINVQNIGKVKSAKLKIRPFTVISGANSSGKSFITKTLYSLFNTISQDHLTISSSNIVMHMRGLVYACRHNLVSPSYAVSSELEELEELIDRLYYTLIVEFGSCTYSEQVAKSYIVKEMCNKIINHLSMIQLNIEGIKKYEGYAYNIKIIKENANGLNNIFDNQDETLITHISNGFKDALKDNFQVTNLFDLKNNQADKNDKIKLDFGVLGSFEINGDDIKFKLKRDSLNYFQSLNNVVFIESPIYWKLRNSLRFIKENNTLLNRFRFGTRKDSTTKLSGVPKYVDDLMSLVEEKFKTSDANESNIELYSEIVKTIGGELDISESGDIIFNQNQQSININLTATGIANLGLIALLLKRNVISKGSYIFVDEPEVNLHPAWQKVMVQTLYKLSMSGINVVIASHSIDMMKYIENIIDGLDFKIVDDHFAINQLSNEGISLNDGAHPSTVLASIKSDLGASFFDMFLDSNSW
ncbi:ABC transporter ATP-binding protein [Vibrio cholerae]|nr:ABC transporter ATP-binding protein [Vibrio cholerae]